jgi:hypothetical protein
MKSLTYEEKKLEWWEWHQRNPEIWLMFEKFTEEAIARGVKKMSHWLVINRIRWEVSIATFGNEFKISNDFIAFYARMWNALHPQHKDIFTTKKMKGEP